MSICATRTWRQLFRSVLREPGDGVVDLCYANPSRRKFPKRCVLQFKAPEKSATSAVKFFKNRPGMTNMIYCGDDSE